MYFRACYCETHSIIQFTAYFSEPSVCSAHITVCDKWKH